MKLRLMTGALSLAAPALMAHAAATDASRVVAVKLYPGVATVERALQLPPGAQQAVFACLPAGLDVASLRVDADAGIRVGDLSTRQQPRKLLGNACASPLDERIRALEDQIAALEAESTGLDYALGYLQSFGDADNALQGKRAAPAASASIGATATALGQSAKSALTRQHQIKRQQQVLEEELNPLLAERERAGAKEALVSTVQVILAAPQGGQLRLSYQVRGPSWQPGYRATLNTATRKVTLERQALVAQNTGEDWSGVQLTLSTGQPAARTQGPLPRPWRVGIAPPVQARAAAEKATAAMPPAPAPAPASTMALSRAASAEVEEMPSFDVSSIDTGFATEFSVPQKITVPSSGQRVSLSLGEHVADASLIVRTAPALDSAAYLIANLPAPPGVWPAGSLSLYRDKAFVGSGRLDTAELPRTGLAFGRDELVNVRAESPEHNRGSGGFIGSRNEQREQRIYTVENRHKTPITVQVLDAAPVAEHEDVRIESRYHPKPESTEWNGQKGSLLWQTELAAGASGRFTAEHAITWPKDARLRERK